MELIEKISMLFISLLLGVLLFTGCSKSEEPGNGGDAGNAATVTGTDSGNTGAENADPAGTANITATPMPTATPEPTPTPPFVKTAYETAGRDDIYRIPLTEIDNEKGYFMSNKYAGNYTLFWIDVPVKIVDVDANNVPTGTEEVEENDVPADTDVTENPEINDISTDTENTENTENPDDPEYNDIPEYGVLIDYRTEYTDKNILVLMQPTVSDVQYRYEFDYMINEPFLLDDGTVIIEEMEGRTVHVLNDELKEVLAFTPEEDHSSVLGVDGDG